MVGNNKAWDDYWENSASQGACLPCADAAIDGVLKAWWTEFADKLPPKARLLDLATGNGVVIERIQAKRRDVRATGVDAAPKLPKPKGKFQLRGGINIEQLPFGEESFDAISSQFGIEYSDTIRTLGHVGRLLKPGGLFGAVIHIKPGPILAHNLPRLAGLDWACNEAALPERARNWVRQRAFVGTNIPPLFREAPMTAEQKFGLGGAGHEFAMAVLQSLEVGLRLPPAESLKMIGELEAMAHNEVGRIRSLESAAMDRSALNRFVQTAQESGLGIEQAAQMSDYYPNADFGWLVVARKD
jgi:SAM-dependent methyltransferase